MVQDLTREAYCRPQPTHVERYSDPNSRTSAFQHGRYGYETQQRFTPLNSERSSLDGSEFNRVQDGYDVHRRQPPMRIDEALRLRCGIAAKQYFVAVISESGEPMTFYSPGQKLQDTTISQFFDKIKFQQVMERIDTSIDPFLNSPDSPNDGGRSHRSRGMNRQRDFRIDEYDIGNRHRKRHRVRNTSFDDVDTPMSITQKQGVRVSNPQETLLFYEQRFKNCQQTACKIISKAWVKAIEPKKQSNYPYTKHEASAPPWWPIPWGPGPEDFVRHKEPDHLHKGERVHLLTHILRLVLEQNSLEKDPNIKQSLSVTMTVKRLEEITFEVMSNFFKDSEANGHKKRFLNDLFRVASKEERYRKGEIDESTLVNVMGEDSLLQSSESDDDDGSTRRNSWSKATGITPRTPKSEHSQSSSMHSGSLMSDIPMRGYHSTPASISDMGPQQQSGFAEGGAMPTHGHGPTVTAAGNMTLDMVTSPTDASRRTSLFSEYAGSGGNMYSQPWSPTSTSATTSPPYAYTTSNTAPSSGYVNHVVSMNNSQPFMAGSFDATSPRTGYDGAPTTSLIREGEPSQTSSSSQQGYNHPPS